MQKYLRHYAEPETAALAGLPGGEPWANVVVIPACNEKPGFLRPPPACDGRSLMILVINEPVSASAAVSSGNRALAATLQNRFEERWQSARECPDHRLSLHGDPRARRDVLLVDRYSEGRKLPAKGGVGQARKIGADLATSLINGERIHSPWIHCTDADARLPGSYFECGNAVTDSDSSYAALLYPFRHCDDPHKAESVKVMLATQLYELSLRYYVAGMKFAHSPYAFHTIGSTMAVDAAHYAKVRGFPRRAAGEDFYLLNKLAKVGAVRELELCEGCEPVEIEARRSDRVPFGTGAAVTKINELNDPVKEFRFYHPAVFEILRHWLQVLPGIWRSGPNDLSAVILPDHAGDGSLCHVRRSLLPGLKKIGVDKALHHAFKQSGDQDQFMRQMDTWFDAFRTLKLIHFLRDHHLPPVSYEGLGENRIFSQLLAQDPGLRASYKQLNGK